MIRKLVRQGQQAYTITLPIGWIRENNLEVGNEIKIEPIENSLLITTKTRETTRETAININFESEQLIRICLNNAYRLGFDKLNIFFETASQAQTIRNTIEDQLLAFEIVEEKPNQLIVESVAEPSEEKQSHILRRIFQIISDSFNILIADTKNLPNIKAQTKRFDKYNNFCRRSMSKKRFSEEKVSIYWQLFAELTLIQHSILHLCEFLGQSDIDLSKKAKDILSKLQQEYKNLETSFFKKDIIMLEKTNNITKDILYKEIYPALRKSTNEENVVLHYIGELSRLIYLATIPSLAILAY